jgi:hypothetical protein
VGNSRINLDLMLDVGVRQTVLSACTYVFREERVILDAY